MEMEEEDLIMVVEDTTMEGEDSIMVVEDLTASLEPRKLIFGMQLSFNLTKRNIEKQIGIILRLSFKSLF